MPLPATVSPDGSQTQAQAPPDSRKHQGSNTDQPKTKRTRRKTNEANHHHHHHHQYRKHQHYHHEHQHHKPPMVRKRAQGWIGGRKGRGKRWGSRRDSSRAPGTLFFFFFFDYTNTYIHLEVQLRDPNNGVPVFYIYTHPSTRPHHHTNSVREKAQTMRLASFGPYVSFYIYICLFSIC